MLLRSLLVPGFLAAMLAMGTGAAQAEDAATCFGTADRVTSGETVDDETKRKGHEACQRALAETSSVVQKYHLQEADFDIIGRPTKPEN
jgi:hypothetical protein